MEYYLIQKSNYFVKNILELLFSDALKYVDSILSWLETQKNLDPSFILKALELRDLACQKMVENDTNALISNSVLINQIKETYSESKSEYIVRILKIIFFSKIFIDSQNIYCFSAGTE